jgi:hypothetical protein
LTGRKIQVRCHATCLRRPASRCAAAVERVRMVSLVSGRRLSSAWRDTGDWSVIWRQARTGCQPSAQQLHALTLKPPTLKPCRSAGMACSDRLTARIKPLPQMLAVIATAVRARSAACSGERLISGTYPGVAPGCRDRFSTERLRKQQLTRPYRRVSCLCWPDAAWSPIRLGAARA